MRFDGRVALVTGAGRGLGQQYAKLLAERGARVVVNDLGCEVNGAGRSSHSAGDTVEVIVKAGGSAIASADDISRAEGARAAVTAALREWGRLDIIVNNAGIFIPQSFSDLTDDAWSRTLDTHIGGTFQIVRAGWEHMRDTGYGRIVNTCSATIYGLPGTAAYSAAKGAVLGLTKTLAIEGAEHGIKVNAVMPFAATRITDQTVPEGEFRSMFDHMFPPEKVAGVVAWLAHEDVPCTGEIFETGGGYVRRVLLAATTGLAWDRPTPEDLHSAYTTIADPSHTWAPKDSNDALQSITQHLQDQAADIPDWIDTAQAP